MFAGILLTVLLAIELARRIQPNPVRSVWPLARAVAIAFDDSDGRTVGACRGAEVHGRGSPAFAPVFCVNLVFAERFQMLDRRPGVRRELRRDVGGTLEYASLVSGYRALLIVAAILYGLAFLSGFGIFPGLHDIGRPGNRLERELELLPVQ